VEQADQGDFMAVRFRGSLLVLALVTAGCQAEPTVAHFVTRDAGPIGPPEAAARTPAQQAPAQYAPVQQAPAQRTSAQHAPAQQTVVPVAHEELPATAPLTSSANNEKIDPLLSGTELSIDQLLAAVEERNPSLAAMVAAWQAAAQRYPQAVALDDPMLQFMLAPASLGSAQVEPAYAIQASQKLPWYGKRDARGQAATAEANAAYFDAEESRLRLREATRLVFLEYYLVQRNLELNRNDVRVMQELRRTAVTKYEANQVTQQDVLQADVELADLERRRLELDRMQNVAIARINTLLGRRPDVPLPLRDSWRRSTRCRRPSSWSSRLLRPGPIWRPCMRGLSRSRRR